MPWQNAGMKYLVGDLQGCGEALDRLRTQYPDIRTHCGDLWDATGLGYYRTGAPFTRKTSAYIMDARPLANNSPPAALTALDPQDLDALVRILDRIAKP